MLFCSAGGTLYFMDNQNYTQQVLFQLPYRSEAEIREIIRPLHPFLWPVIMDPWEDLLRRRATDKAFTDLTPEEMGIWLTMQAGKMAQGIFHGRQGIEVKLVYRKPVIIIPEALAIMVKKLTKRNLRGDRPPELTRSNYMTQRTKSVYNQEHDAFLNLPRVTLGYEFLKEASDIRVLVAYPRTRGRHYEWVYRLSKPARIEQEFPKLAIYTHADEHAGEPAESRGFTVGPRETEREEKESGKE